MIFNTIKNINPTSGDWILLADNGYDGISVVSQHHDPQEAVLAIKETYGSNYAIVRLADLQITVTHNNE